MIYDRDTLVNVIVYHGRTSIKGCHCGWAEPGRSHPEHVADIYEASVAAPAVVERQVCEGFAWIGQSLEFCDDCGQPAWLHSGVKEQKPDRVPFDVSDDAWQVRPWKPGQRTSMAARYGVEYTEPAAPPVLDERADGRTT